MGAAVRKGGQGTTSACPRHEGEGQVSQAKVPSQAERVFEASGVTSPAEGRRFRLMGRTLSVGCIGWKLSFGLRG